LHPRLNETPVRVLLVLFLPGYSLIAALFPRKDDLDGIERIALSFGLSIAVVPLIGLGLNYGIRLVPLLLRLSLFTILLALAAGVRRAWVSEAERFVVAVGGWGQWRMMSLIMVFSRDRGANLKRAWYVTELHVDAQSLFNMVTGVIMMKIIWNPIPKIIRRTD